MAPEREIRLDPLLQYCLAQLVETPDRRLGEGRIREVGKRRAAPERERFPQARGSGGGIVGSQIIVGPIDQQLEAMQIQLAAVEPDRDSRAGA